MADSPLTVAPLPLAMLSAPDGQCVQVNPFCRAAPAALGDPVELIPLPPLAGAASRVMQSSGQQLEGQTNAGEQGAVHVRIQESSQQVGGGVRSNPLAGSLPAPISDLQGVQPLVAASGRATPASGAISFSLTDKQSGAVEIAPDPPRGTVPAVVRALPPTRLPEADSQPRARVPWRGSSGSNPHTQEPTPTLARPSQAGRTLLVPIEEHRDGQVVSAVGGVRLPEPKHSDEPRLVNGSRPKVEVGRPPLAIQRGRSLALDARPKPVEPMRTPVPDDAVAAISQEEILPTPQLSAKANLALRLTEVRALKIENAIHRVEIQDAAVCAAVKTAANQVQLIATGVGATKLILWTMDSAGDEQGELYEIHVAEVQAAQADDAESIAATLTQSVGNAFPKSRILVRYHGGRLQVTGTCEDEGSARRILRMVRSACPMPVDDKVMVR